MDDREERINEYKKKIKKKKRRNPFKFIIFILSFLVLIFICKVLVDKYMPNFEQISIRTVFPEWSDNGKVIILKDTPIQLQNPPIEQDNEIFLPVEFVKSYIDKYIFWEPSSNKLTITTENKVIKMKTDELTAYVNNQPLELDIPIKIENNTAYIPASLIETLYYFKIDYSQETDIVIVDYTDQPQSVGKISTKKASMRSKADIKSPIVNKIVLNDEVNIYPDTDNDEWVKIRTKSGIVGYIKSKYISNINQLPAKQKEVTTPTEIWKPSNGKINLVWDMVTNYAASVTPERLRVTDGLDVMSPTWFRIEDENGNIANIANKNYVDWAHQNGYKVWALFANKYGEKPEDKDRFNPEMTHKVLVNTEARENLVKQLLALAATYDLDGINIDFEELKQEDGDYFLQFIRELTPLAKQQGLIISVDVLVPMPHSKHYQRDELAKIVDYVIVMAYDEHWENAPESGSVASINWVRNGIKNCLEQEQIPADKLIMAIPYYCRLWTETPQDDGGIKVRSKSYGMDTAKKILKDNNVEPTWDNETAQYYGEYQKDNITYKMWLEDERSISEKLKLVGEYDLAGIAGWHRMLSNNEVWNILKENLKQ